MGENRPEGMGRPVWMEGQEVCLIDQRLLPYEEVVLRPSGHRETISLIRQMAVRGAGTIGVTGGFAMVQAALESPLDSFWPRMCEAAAKIRSARPTAKNLSYSVDRILSTMEEAQADTAAARQSAFSEAQAFYEENIRMTERIGQAGLALIPEGRPVLTHCNAGWLACTGWGTALAPIYKAHQEGKEVFVIATETRPRLQGAKLTSWELKRAGVPHTLIADTAAGHLMKKGQIGLVIVGADRIAANGDTANKIGTYPLAILAKAHGIPFYVAAPSPTFDPSCSSGQEIPIEERDEEEILQVSGVAKDGRSSAVRVAPSGVGACNPAFDVTPAQFIAGFITECGIIEPSAEAIARFLVEADYESARPVSRLKESR